MSKHVLCCSLARLRVCECKRKVQHVILIVVSFRKQVKLLLILHDKGEDV